MPLFLTASTASPITGTGRVRAKRTWPFPSVPKLLPGVQRTLHDKIHVVRKALRNARPGEHGSLAVRHIPTYGAKSAAEGVPSSLVFLTLSEDGLLRSVQRGNGAVLHRKEGSVIDLGAEFFEAGDDFREKNSTQTSFAPGTARMEPPRLPSKMISE